MPYFRSKWLKINNQSKGLIYEGEPPFQGDLGIIGHVDSEISWQGNSSSRNIPSVAEIRSNTDVYYSATQINIQVFVNHDATQPTSQISVFS